MHIPNLEVLEHARREIENVVSARYLDQQAVPYFAPTDFGTLPPEMQHAELCNEEANNQGNVARASIHMCLASAIAALQVSEALLRESGQSSPLERTRVRMQCAADMRAAATVAMQASSVLAGERGPSSNSLMDIRRA